jgi:hypothetical protein
MHCGAKLFRFDGSEPFDLFVTDHQAYPAIEVAWFDILPYQLSLC